MNRYLLTISLATLVGLTAGCGSDDAPWDFEDSEAAYVEDVIANADPGTGEDPDDDPDDDPEQARPELTDYELPEWVEPAAATASCGGDLPEFSVPSEIEGELRQGRGLVDEHTCTRALGRERRFRIVIDEPVNVRIWTDYENTDFSPVLLLQAGCGENTADLYCSSPLNSHPGGANANIQARLERGVYTLTIDERNNQGWGDGGSFRLFVEEADLEPNATCESARVLAPGDLPTISETMHGGSGALTGCFGSIRPAHFWRVRMPAQTGARVRAEYLDPERQQGPYIRIRQACEQFCEGSQDSGDVSIANTANESVDYIVSVSDNGDAPIRVWVEGFTPLAENATCESATPTESGDWIRGNPIEGSAHAPLCGEGTAVRQLYYEVPVPPNHRLLTGVYGQNVVAYESCGDRTCMYDPVNTSGATKNYILAIGSRAETQFSFAPQVVPLAPNRSCDTAAPLEVGRQAWAYEGRGGAERGSCDLVFAEGYTFWYSATIPPQTNYELRVERFEGSHLNVEVIDGGCNGTCSDEWDAYFYAGVDPVVALTNDRELPRDVLIAVTPDGQRRGTPGYFTVALTEQAVQPR